MAYYLCPVSDTRDLTDSADANSRAALARIAELQSQVSQLKSEPESQGRLLDATGKSLEEARQNHNSPLNTFNANVAKANQREEQQDRDIDWLLKRNGI